MVTIWHYLNSSGKDIFEEWFDSLADENAQARIAVRIDRLAAGNFGNVSRCKKACGNCGSIGGPVTGFTMA